jgi:hypothetical protein
MHMKLDMWEIDLYAKTIKSHNYVTNYIKIQSLCLIVPTCTCHMNLTLVMTYYEKPWGPHERNSP